MRNGFLIGSLIFLSILYFSHLFVIYTINYVFGYEMTRISYLIPLFIISFFGIIVFAGKLISDYFYSLMYTVMGIYLGYFLYIFQTSVVMNILMSIFSIKKNFAIYLLFGVPFIICIYGILNALKTNIIRIKFKYPGYKKKINILHLSDIHLGAIHQKNSVIRICNEIINLNPDIVVITGDMADGTLKVKQEWLTPFDNLKMPILYITGNHEEMNPKKDMINVVNKSCIKYIGKNEQFLFNDVNFIGVDFGYDLKKCLLNIEQKNGVPNVLLSHVPILKPEELAKYNIFLFLAGHTHGGQLFPFHILVYLANACFAGLYSDCNKTHHIFVSEGVNNAVIPMRVGSSRVFAMITIEGNE